MTNPKDVGGSGREVPEQPAGTPDRTFANREAFPRDVDEGRGRHVQRDKDAPATVTRQNPRQPGSPGKAAP